jgi:hypothetical protein
MLFDKFANTALCQHARLNNQPCGQPALRGRKFCRFHDTDRIKDTDYSIPMVEDALSLQLAIMQVIRALHDRAMDSKTAALTLYALQIASGNLKRFTAEQSSTSTSNPAQELSLLESLVKALALPETPEELMAEMSAQSRDSAPPTPWPPIGAATITNSPASEE